MTVAKILARKRIGMKPTDEECKTLQRYIVEHGDDDPLTLEIAKLCPVEFEEAYYAAEKGKL